MIRIRRASEVFLMAGVAGRAVRQVISTGRAKRGVVALRALQGRVRAGQREAGGRVIEVRASPVGGVVALLAGRREAGLNVVRIRGVVEIRLVASIAGRVVRQIVSAGRADRGVVALCALQ